VPEAVDGQVEPAAGADLSRPHRQASGAATWQQAAEQRAAAAHLVGLHRPPDQLCGARRLLLDDGRAAGQTSPGVPPTLG
jgi:hypothetical protein